MISRILNSTTGKPCSCPEGKICKGCKKKKSVKPQVYIEEPRRLPASIVIQRYQEKPSTAAQDNPKRWSIRKAKVQTKSPVKKTLCQWYRRRKALKELKVDHQRDRRREKQERLERARRERENEVLEYLKLQADTAPAIEKKPKQQEQKPKHVKARTTSAKPRADSKFVSVKQYNRYDSLSTRFVNCCYRICCQFYCYLSSIFVIGLVLIYFF